MNVPARSLTQGAKLGIGCGNVVEDVEDSCTHALVLLAEILTEIMSGLHRAQKLHRHPVMPQIV